jgi:hypothetical protein
MSLGGRRGKVAIDRYNALLAIEQSPDGDTAFARLQEIGVRWYVAMDRSTPAWDPTHDLAAYTRGSVAVYDTRKSQGTR